MMNLLETNNELGVEEKRRCTLVVEVILLVVEVICSGRVVVGT